MHRERVHILIPTPGDPLSVPEILLSVSMLRGLYIAAAGEISRLNHSIDDELEVDLAHVLAEKVALRIEGKHADAVQFQNKILEIGRDELAPSERGADMELIDLARRNPIELVVLAFGLPLMVAVILSGGKYHLGPLKVELPPLGKGIQSLRAAFSPLSAQRIRNAAAKRPATTGAPEKVAALRQRI